jgi:hypothetical protein
VVFVVQAGHDADVTTLGPNMPAGGAGKACPICTLEPPAVERADRTGSDDRFEQDAFTQRKWTADAAKCSKQNEHVICDFAPKEMSIALRQIRSLVRSG